ncbi:MAG: Y-family DNA polymerase [SAR324 cluster bacterium]|jgi:DNA polymerase V|nr:Y-family DNA polymerase [SAR324 cluster bacterium]
MIALIDCNNFFASCEQVFQPQLAGKPLVVLSNNDGNVIARSSEAKKLGIGMGVLAGSVREFVRSHELQIRSSNYALYGDMSSRIMFILEELLPRIERYSIDEAFADVSGLSRERLVELFRLVRHRILRHTGIQVSIGVARTKTLAKAANRLAKRCPELAGVCIGTEAESFGKTLEQMETRDVWGIGGKISRKLSGFGIGNAKQLRDADPAWIKKQFSVTLMRTVLELRGESCLKLEEPEESRKSIMCGRSFGKPLKELEDIRPALTHFVQNAVSRLWKYKQATSAITVYLSTNRFRKNITQRSVSASVELEVTNNLMQLNAAAQRALGQIFKSGFEYHKVGVLLHDFISVKNIPATLFETESSIQASQELMGAVKKINQKFGRYTVASASVSGSSDWKARSKFRSPAFTTCWNELPLVQA